MPLKKPFSPVGAVPALDVPALPLGTVSGCSLAAVPRMPLALAKLSSVALLLENKLWEQQPGSPVD